MGATTIRQRLVAELSQALDVIKQRDGFTQIPEIKLVLPKEETHGDFACNVAFALAKQVKKAPRLIAQDIVQVLGNGGGLVEKAEVAGAGFINLFVATNAWYHLLHDILVDGTHFIESRVGAGLRVLVEFVSANPTGPLHVAHGRGAVAGDVIARLLEKAGYDVHREYYINDLGNQADILARSLHVRYSEILGRDIEKPDDFYPGSYVTGIAQTLVDEFGEQFLDTSEANWLSLFRTRGMSQLLTRIQTDLQSFGVDFDCYMSERKLMQQVDLNALIKRLSKANSIYIEDGKTWFKSTLFGDDKDRVLIREDGRPTYFASDIAYHDDKMARGYNRLINVWGADHGGYVARVKAGLAALGHDPNSLDVVLVQMVSLSRKGEKIRMGKRMGTAIWLSDVVQEAGCDATRFFFAMRKFDAQLDFDIDLATKKSLDNPVYYAQMGHARLCSIEKRAQEAGIPAPIRDKDVLKELKLPEEIALIKALSQAPEVIAEAARAYEPHQVVHYLQDLIAIFHRYYTTYKNTEKIISDNAKQTHARLLLCQALRTLLAELLLTLGVSAPESMFLDETDSMLLREKTK